MTNPNPLDRIRALAPADMTDDELGVAVNYEAGLSISYSPGKTHSPNPALSYDALLPIVREWVRSNAIGIDEYKASDISEHGVLAFEWVETCEGRDDLVVSIDLQATPRQLAEAFVTAARSVQ